MKFNISNVFSRLRLDHPADAPNAARISTGRHVQDEANGGDRRNAAQRAQEGRHGRSRFLNRFLAQVGLRRNATRAPSPLPDAGRMINDPAADDTPGADSSVRTDESAPARTAGSEMYLASLAATLKIILAADWKDQERDIANAVGAGNLHELDRLLYSGPLRSFPLAAKNVVLIALRYPDELNNPAFEKLYRIAARSGYVPERNVNGPESSIDLLQAIDPAFNPGATLATYYMGLSNERNAQPSAGIGQSVDGNKRNALPELLQDEREILEWSAASSKWIVIHDTAAAIQAGLEKVRSLNTAYDTYIASRRTE